MMYCLPHIAHLKQGIDQGATGHLKITFPFDRICFLRLLAYGTLSVLSDDLLTLSEFIGNVGFEHFYAIVITAVSPAYLCALFGEDIN